jgi:2-(1,2-epoxy-1,2-dihydrophenyl)acetyl-CoA isomerase
MESPTVTCDKSNNIATITFTNPKRLNAVDLGTLNEMLVLLNKCEKDESIRVIVISGEGSSFCAGADIQNIVDNGWDTIPFLIRDMARAAADVALKMRNMRKPIIASLKGAVAGAGFNIALSSDFRIGADNCKFIQAFVNIGLIPDTGGMFLLSRLLGSGRATELAMTGRTVNAEEAMSVGLLTKIVPLDDLESETMQLAHKLAQCPGQALMMMKGLIYRNDFSGFETYLDNEVEYQFNCAKTEDFKEGVRAFLEKRKPKFQSR